MSAQLIEDIGMIDLIDRLAGVPQTKLFLRVRQQQLCLLGHLDLFQDQLIYQHNFLNLKL